MSKTKYDPNDFPKSIAQVNAYLKQEIPGTQERLVKGDGYYYFAEGDSDGWYQTSVCVAHVDELPFYRWKESYLFLKDWYAGGVE